MNAGTQEHPLRWESRGKDVYCANGAWFMRDPESNWIKDWVRASPSFANDIRAAVESGEIHP